ncbi:hypothetical protein [Priestia endophytica]|nr:hypothetical protein [Priestia endophytica]MCY8234816.1 hypothetical protein [Priestia endophytica]
MENDQQINLYSVIGKMAVQQKVLTNQILTLQKENEELKKQLEQKSNKK